MSGKEIVLGITGSIGAYKAADVVRRLKERGYGVTCVMTKEATQFLSPLTLQALSERQVHVDLFDPHDLPVIHTKLADQASLVLVAPATANVIGKLANGLADDLLTCIVLATKAPVLVAPAMNVHMYQHPTVQGNVVRLKKLGCRFIGPAVGQLACGYEAIGQLAEVDEIVQTVTQLVPAPVAAVAAPARVAPPHARNSHAKPRLARAASPVRRLGRKRAVKSRRR